MSSKLEELVICGAVRTPFSFGTSLKEFKPECLLATVLNALVDKYSLDSNVIQAVATGSVKQDTSTPNVAKIASQLAGFPNTTRDYSVQSNCNSGFVGLQTVIGNILLGDGDVYIASGVESMSNFGYRLQDVSNKYGSLSELEAKMNENGKEFLQDFNIIDCLEEGLKDQENDLAMIEIAEIMANVYEISREDQDAYTLENLKRAVDAVESGILDPYICSIEGLSTPIGVLKRDAYPLNRKRMLKRPENFAKAACVFAADSAFINAADFFNKHSKHFKELGFKGSQITPSVSMYNACIPGDGAGAAIVTTESRAKELGLKPVLRIVSWGSAGVNPVVMGIGPMEATNEAFSKPKTARAKGIEMDNMDVVEIHEAFAAQVKSVFKQSKIKYNREWDLNKVNPYGGSLAFTHPLGATNYRLITNILTYFDHNTNAKYALATGCAGGGHGSAFVFERF